MREQLSKTTRCKLCCEKLGSSHDVKSFAIGSFLERFVVKISINYRSSSSEICPENSHEIGQIGKIEILAIVFWRS